MNQCSTFSF